MTHENSYPITNLLVFKDSSLKEKLLWTNMDTNLYLCASKIHIYGDSRNSWRGWCMSFCVLALSFGNRNYSYPLAGEQADVVCCGLVEGISIPKRCKQN